jgi:hypothetical protein
LGSGAEGASVAQIHWPSPIQIQKFKTYEEYNAWKKEYLLEIARHGGVKWLNDLSASGEWFISPHIVDAFFISET